MGSVALDSERTLAGAPAEVRRELTRALVELGFRVTSEQVTLVEARRGSLAAGAFLGSGKMPVVATALLGAGEAGGCRVHVRLEDRVGAPAWGMSSQYEQIFAAIQSRLDAALARLDPNAAASFATPRFTAGVGRVPLLDTAQRIGGELQQAAAGRVNQLLEGGPTGRAPATWRRLDTVVLRASRDAAVLRLEELQAHLAIAVLVSSQRGSMPASLAGQVEALAARIEAHLAAGSRRFAEIPIADEERPVVDFLHQQARLREQLPVRTLHRCRACRFERVTNPDLQRLQRRNRRLRALGMSVGATLRPHGISPFVLVGSIFRFADLDPEYVCPRCQGTDAEAMVVTFCPGCGDLRAEAALRGCAKCDLDLRSLLSDEAGIWTPYASLAPAAAAAEPPVRPMLPPAGGTGATRA